MAIRNLLFFNKKGEQYNFEWNGNYWEGSVLFPKVSEKLFEIEHIFIIEKFLDGSPNKRYGFPHTDPTINPSSPLTWRTTWESDFDLKNDVTSIIYTYELGIDNTLDAPVLVKAEHVEFYPEIVAGDSLDQTTGLTITNNISSSSIQINISLNSDTEGIYERTLLFEDYTDPLNPVTILKVNFHGEVEGEDSRLSVILANFGRSFINSDSFISRDSDIQEPFPNYEIINNKRKELLLAGESIFPYIGSYKALFNAIKFFGYYDLRIKEYWLNIHKDSSHVLTPLQQNSKVLKQLGIPNIEGLNSLELISSLLNDENEGKFKQIEIYGKRADGTFGLKKQFEEIFPSKSYKKTSLFGLFYDINRENEDGLEDEFGYPIVEDVFLFSPDEVLIKLFGLRERLKRDYLPLNARIIDITGEGIYFNIYKTRGWVDQLDINELKSGIKVDFTVTPNNGYIEDLRPFYIKQNQNGLLYPAIDGAEQGISYYGNTIEPYSHFQEYPIQESALLVESIEKFYTDIKNENAPKFFGDGDYDYSGYRLFSTGEDYVYPAGCPIILEDNSFDLSWDDINGDWRSLDNGVTTTPLEIASYFSTSEINPGTPSQTVSSNSSITISNILPQYVTLDIGVGNDWFNVTATQSIFIRVESAESLGNLILGYSSAGDYVNGELKVRVISTRGSGTYSNWKITPTNLSFSNYVIEYFQNWIYSGGFYSWDRLPYLDYYEIEWKIDKNDGRPYHFETRGPLPGLNKIPHFLPYTGEYTIQCRVWDTLNSISHKISRNIIKVDKRQIELNTLTRFRESEFYDWDNTILDWDNYSSQWIFPVENTENYISDSEFIKNFPEYSNNFDDGQECEVFSKLPEVKATATFDIGIYQIPIDSIVSDYIGGGYSFAKVTTTAPHGYNEGDYVYIIGSDNLPYGQFPVGILNTTSFVIPQIITEEINGGYSYGPGNIKIIIDDIEIANCNFNGNLDSTCGLLYYSINNSLVSPKYKITSLIDSTIPLFKDFTIQAPNNSGSLWNGKNILVQTTGSIRTNTTNVIFNGGENEREDYVPYNFGDLPKFDMRYWGTKRLSWDTFEDLEFSKAYAHTWDMFDYHNDWLGGFDLYSLQYGDRIRVTEDSDGIVMSEVDSPPNNYLDLSEAAFQLNNSIDENIKRFDYIVRGFSKLPNNFYQNSSSISPDLSTKTGPLDIKQNYLNVYGSPSMFFPSEIGWDGDGDIWITGQDVVSFDGTNFTKYDSNNSILPGNDLQTNCIYIDKDDNKWIGIENNDIPLVKINDRDHTKSLSFRVSDFIDNNGELVCPDVLSSIKVIEINKQNGDVFCAYTSNGSHYGGLLHYNSKYWTLYRMEDSNISSNIIRDLKIEYYGINGWYLWIATNNGLSRFDGVDFKNYQVGSSGIPSDDVYSIVLDSLNHKWIGTSSGIVYWDHQRWAVWNNSTNPEIIVGNCISITDIGNGNVWFIMMDGFDGSLYHFDGYLATKIEYRENGLTPIRPYGSGKSMLCAPWKTIKNGKITYPKNLFLMTIDYEICIIDYIIPHIHATSKFAGVNGWDFIYHDTSLPLPQIQYVHEYANGALPSWFSFSQYPLNNNITLDSSLIRPIMPSVDNKSWYKPIWQRYTVDYLKTQFPSLDLDNVFLYSTLRDILDGKATKENYWRNSQIERIASKKSRDLFDNFEWLITQGNNYQGQGIKVTVDKEGDIIVIGDFKGIIYMGSVNNIAAQDVYLDGTGSPMVQSIYIAKYNKSGVLQWAKSILGEENTGDISARSIVADSLNNLYIVYDYQAIPGSSTMMISKYNSSGALLSSTSAYVSNPSTDGFIGDIKIDKYQNIYICGGFKGIATFGNNIVDSYGLECGYIAKLDSNLNFIFINKLAGSSYCRAFELAILDELDIYLTGLFIGTLDFINTQLSGPGNYDLFIAKLDSNNGLCSWKKSFAFDSNSSIFSPSICADKNGNVLITGTFTGAIEIEDKKITSLDSSLDIFVIKMLSTGKLKWIKMCGGELGDTSFDIETDSNENVYITGSFSGNSYFSPSVIQSRTNSEDIYIGKFNNEGTLIDIVTSGGISNDAGVDLILDNEENLYVTGYFYGESDFSPYIVTSPSNSISAFLGKIPKQRFYEGYKIGSVQSWLGSHSWSWKESKLYKNEFEIPLASTIFINPIDSLIPGKKEHIWTLSDAFSGEVIVKLRKTPYFIWTFINAGFYTISCQLQDANGNVYETQHKGKIRVIDHKNPKAGDLIPSIVNSSDYSKRTIYEMPI